MALENKIATPVVRDSFCKRQQLQTPTDVMGECPTDRLRSTPVSMIVTTENFGIAKLRRMDCLNAFNFGLTKLFAKIPILIYSFVKPKLCQENFH